MKLTIFAATGGIGRQLLEQAIAAGHDVTAVARNPQNLSPIPARAVAADLASADPAVLQPALAGADAVLSALGPRTKADAGVAARGTKVITQAMRAAGVRRVIVVSAAPIGTVPSPGRPHPPRHDPGDGFILRYLADPIVKRALRDHYADPGSNPRERFTVAVTQDDDGSASGVAITSARQPLVDDLTVRQTGAIAYALSGVVNERIEAQQQVVSAELEATPRSALEKLDRVEIAATGPGA